MDNENQNPVQEQNNVKDSTKTNGLSIASFVLGLIGFIAWILPVVGYPVTIIGLVLGCIARGKEKNTFNLTGIILSIITLVLTLANSCLGVIMTLSQM